MFVVLPLLKSGERPDWLSIQKPKLKIRLELTKGIDLHYGFTGKGIDCIKEREDTVGHCTVGSCEPRNTLAAILQLWVL